MNDRLPRAASAAQSSLRVCVCSLGVFLSRKRMCCGFAAVAHCRFKWLKLAVVVVVIVVVVVRRNSSRSSSSSSSTSSSSSARSSASSSSSSSSS